jgi:hypothetical protein
MAVSMLREVAPIWERLSESEQWIVVNRPAIPTTPSDLAKTSATELGLSIPGVANALGWVGASKAWREPLGSSAAGLESIDERLSPTRCSAGLQLTLDMAGVQRVADLAPLTLEGLTRGPPEFPERQRDGRQLLGICIEEALLRVCDLDQLPLRPLPAARTKLQDELALLIGRWNSGRQRTAATQAHIEQLLSYLRHEDPNLFLQWRAGWEGGPATGGLGALIEEGEGQSVERKATLRTEAESGSTNRERQRDVAKAICALLNSEGGWVLIGVRDDGSIHGIEADMRSIKRHPDRDGFEQALRGVIGESLGEEINRLVQVRFENADDKTVAVCEVGKSPSPVFLSEGNKNTFYIRAGNVTRPLDPKETYSYTQAHWG